MKSQTSLYSVLLQIIQEKRKKYKSEVLGNFQANLNWKKKMNNLRPFSYFLEMLICSFLFLKIHFLIVCVLAEVGGEYVHVNVFLQRLEV